MPVDDAQLTGQHTLNLVIDLQVKVAFLDDVVESLNQALSTQQKVILDLQQQMQILYQRMQSIEQGEGSLAPFNAAQEIPPHY